jgi:hypothetical protein
MNARRIPAPEPEKAAIQSGVPTTLNRKSESDVKNRLGASTGLRLGAVVAVIVGVALLAWLVLGGDDDEGGEAGAPQAVSVEDLQEEAGSSDMPVFWAGPQAGSTYEFTETSDGSVYVRYLPDDAEIGDPSPDFLTVATYPLENGYARVLAAAEEEGAETEELPNGGLALVDPDRPSSVYVAYEGEPYQVEVYDPSPDRALDLVTSGAVQPVR